MHHFPQNLSFVDAAMVTTAAFVGFGRAVLSCPGAQIILEAIASLAFAASFSCLPHNGMRITILDTYGYSAREAYPYIFVSTVVVGGVCLAVAVGMGGLMYGGM